MKIDVSGYHLDLNKEKALFELSKQNLVRLRSGKEANTGWVDLPGTFDPELLRDVKATAKEIQKKCTLFIVIGIGGSFLGARCVIEALNKSKPGCPEVVFAGFDMSAAHLDRLVRRIATESVCICVISKSGRTVEPLLTYAVLKDKMFAKYGVEEARRRIYVITDAKEGVLRADAEANGFKAFPVPGNIGGRYSVLSPVGLLPIAVAGHNINGLLRGAADMSTDPRWESELLQYAVVRIALQRGGKDVEIFEYFENNLSYLGLWLVQLFGESEGKEGKGAFPTTLNFSRDLHSIGQFIQQGHQIFYETLISLEIKRHDFLIPAMAGVPYAGKTLEQINDCSEEGVVLAHTKAGIPLGIISVPELTEYHLGQLIYFFEVSAAISAYDLGLNPFDQPGVEAYKSEMKRLVERL